MSVCTLQGTVALGTPAKPVLIFQLHNGLHSSVVVVQVDRPHHLGPLQVPNFHCDLADGVTANKLDNLLGGGVPCVHFNGRQLDILKQEYTRQHSEHLSTYIIQCYQHLLFTHR